MRPSERATEEAALQELLAPLGLAVKELRVRRGGHSTLWHMQVGWPGAGGWGVDVWGWARLFWREGGGGVGCVVCGLLGFGSMDQGGPPSLQSLQQGLEGGDMRSTLQELLAHMGMTVKEIRAGMGWKY